MTIIIAVQCLQVVNNWLAGPKGSTNPSRARVGHLLRTSLWILERCIERESEVLVVLRNSVFQANKGVNSKKFGMCVTKFEGRLGTENYSVVRITYNEDSDVIMTVIRSASQMRSSLILFNLCMYIGYRPLGLSKTQNNKRRKRNVPFENVMGHLTNECPDCK